MESSLRSIECDFTKNRWVGRRRVGSGRVWRKTIIRSFVNEEYRKRRSGCYSERWILNEWLYNYIIWIE